MRAIGLVLAMSLLACSSTGESGGHLSNLTVGDDAGAAGSAGASAGSAGTGGAAGNGGATGAGQAGMGGAGKAGAPGSAGSAGGLTQHGEVCDAWDAAPVTSGACVPAWGDPKMGLEDGCQPSACASRPYAYRCGGKWDAPMPDCARLPDKFSAQPGALTVCCPIDRCVPTAQSGTACPAGWLTYACSYTAQQKAYAATDCVAKKTCSAPLDGNVGAGHITCFAKDPYQLPEKEDPGSPCEQPGSRDSPRRCGMPFLRLREVTSLRAGVKSGGAARQDRAPCDATQEHRQCNHAFTPVQSGATRDRRDR